MQSLADVDARITRVQISTKSSMTGWRVRHGECAGYTKLQGGHTRYLVRISNDNRWRRVRFILHHPRHTALGGEWSGWYIVRWQGEDHRIDDSNEERLSSWNAHFPEDIV